MMFRTCLGWNKQTKSFTIVHKYFIYTYVQFLLTKHACDERLCHIVPCIGENWWHRDMFFFYNIQFSIECVWTTFLVLHCSKSTNNKLHLNQVDTECSRSPGKFREPIEMLCLCTFSVLWSGQVFGRWRILTNALWIRHINYSTFAWLFCRVKYDSIFTTPCISWDPM